MAALEAWFRMDQNGNDFFRAGLGFAENALPPKASDPQAWAAAREALTQRVMHEEGPSRFTGIDLLKSCLESQMSDAKPAERREELAAWLRSLKPNENDFAAQLTTVAQHDGCTAGQANEAWPWLWNSIPKSQRASTLKSIVEYWASDQPWSAKDPNACGQWMNTQMPLGPEHSAALKDFAIHATAADPASGLAWAQANPDPAARTAALNEVHALIRKQWPHRMTELGVPPE